MTQDFSENRTIAGYFEDQKQAERAVRELQEAGFSSAHLGVAHRGGPNASTTGSSSTHTNTGEGMWDKVKSFFEGGAEPYAEERSRGEMATREITTTSSDETVHGGYGHDDLHHSLTGMSVPEERSRYFGQRFSGSENGAVVTVKAGGRSGDAERILLDNGADLGDNPGEYASDDYAQTSGTATEGVQNIQLLGEVLRVHKERINRGEVVVRKEVITENQTVQVPVTREELVIERRAVSGDTQAQGTVGEGREIRIPLTEETASINKDTVVREEISVGKKPVSEVRDLTGDVRREELVVDDRSKRAVNE